MNRMTISDLIEHLRYDTRIIVYSEDSEDHDEEILDFRTFDYFENNLKECENRIIENNEVTHFNVYNNDIIIYI